MIERMEMTMYERFWNLFEDVRRIGYIGIRCITEKENKHFHRTLDRKNYTWADGMSYMDDQKRNEFSKDKVYLNDGTCMDCLDKATALRNVVIVNWTMFMNEMERESKMGGLII